MTTVDVEPQQLLIGGSWVGAESGKTFEKTNAYTGDVATRAAAAGREDARRAVDAAYAASEAWANSAPAERRGLLNRAADLLLERQEEIAATVTEETGATFGWGMFNCMLASGMLREAAAQTYSLIGEVIPSDVPGMTALAIRQPVGVVVGIAPWNAPVILGTRAVATPLAFGNTVVLKASEECPRTHAAIAAVLVDAGLPGGVINFLAHEAGDAGDVVDELIEHPHVRRINFTGSTRVGRIIAEKAGRHLKRVLLELGGKAPMVVLADADLESAVDSATFGAFMHSGQICMSTERIVIDRSVADEFAERLAERAKGLKVGDPRDQSTQIGPLVSDAAAERVTGMIADAQKQGAKILAGGDAEGPLIQPTVIANAEPGMRVYDEESFGPLATMVSVGGVEEAIKVANDTEYGLSAAVFSRDIPQALEVAKRIQSGMCHINGPTVHDEAQMPFGGVKDSGWGRFGGRAALEEFTELRWITIQSTPRHFPI